MFKYTGKHRCRNNTINCWLSWIGFLPFTSQKLYVFIKPNPIIAWPCQWLVTSLVPPYRFPRYLVTNLGTTSSLNLVIHQIWWQICHQIWWRIWWITKLGDQFITKFGDEFSESPNLVMNLGANFVTNLVTNLSPNLVTNLSPNLVTHLVNHQIWWSIWEKCFDKFCWFTQFSDEILGESNC